MKERIHVNKGKKTAVKKAVSAIKKIQKNPPKKSKALSKPKVVLAEIPARSDIPTRDKWDLSRLYKNDADWERDLALYAKAAVEFPRFKGVFSKDLAHLIECLKFLIEMDKLEERLGVYQSLRSSENEADPGSQTRRAKFYHATTLKQTTASFFLPELMGIQENTMKSWFDDPSCSPYRIILEKLLHSKPYILSEKEERIIALHMEPLSAFSKAFDALTDADMDFGFVDTPEGKRKLSHAGFQSLLLHKNAKVREKAYRQYYSVFDGHKNTIATLLSANIHTSVAECKARGYKSVRQAHLYHNKIDESVYDNLILAVRKRLAPLHRYYRLRKKVLGLRTLSHWDNAVQLVKDVGRLTSYDQAVILVIDALAPLGEQYTQTLSKGLVSGWVDKYENRGKSSGAFSAGSYFGDPYILLNYKADDFRNVYTVAHEAGHSMHSHQSTAANPFQHYRCQIFEAEVASTFNEELLTHYLLQSSSDKSFLAYLVNREIDNIVGTIYRQTMFAEFEYRVHTMAETGKPLTLSSMRQEYRELQEAYFGGEVFLPEESSLECLRIPHFYRPFYVYQYATGLSAAIALSRKVLSGGEKERDSYIDFLKTGGSMYPLDSLKRAGVDMSQPEAVESALDA
ncbi:MAG: oligoendopeptidase F, partial [Spirochaetaceae bacterium]